MADERRNSPTEDVQRLYEEAEKRTAQAFEDAVSRPSFGELLARMTENVVGVTKISTDVFDLILRNLRLAGRQDITRLARQLARTEDKLEMVLQEVERLHEELEDTGKPQSRSRGSRSRSSQSTAGNGGQRASRRTSAGK
jgi:hypothetical protein